MTFWPPVSAISTAIGPSRAASCRLMSCATSVEPVKATPATRLSDNSTLAQPRAVARQEGKHLFRYARRVQDFHRARGDQRRLLRRLGDDAVAGRQCGGHLPGEDRQREIPRADADEGPATSQGQFIALTRGARQLQRGPEILFAA